MWKTETQEPSVVDTFSEYTIERYKIIEQA